ncbi:peptidoglycan editing factor PgeF [Silvibacterium acidisoli]|uniref:peptidoglycan editing factor PgeF n=1 Tax=Acidobacteriaceae bacterium ZG23-2 TaxID=2883246 RepID=UPI00406CF76D
MQSPPAAVLDVVRAPVLEKIDWLVHGFSTRIGGRSLVYRKDPAAPGELNLGLTSSDLRETVLANRRDFVQAITGDAGFPYVTLKQVHSADVVPVRRSDASEEASRAADGLVTGDSGVLLAIQTADCIPVLIADRRNRAVGAFHAGWRGTVKGIVEAGLRKMKEEFGTDPSDVSAAVGPGIGRCCFQVGEEVLVEFHQRFAYADDLVSGERHLDLAEANRRQLVECGVDAGSIAVLHECTKTRNDRYFSYRGEDGFTGRMFSVVGIRRD